MLAKYVFFMQLQVQRPNTCEGGKVWESPSEILKGSSKEPQNNLGKMCVPHVQVQQPDTCVGAKV